MVKWPEDDNLSILIDDAVNQWLVVIAMNTKHIILLAVLLGLSFSMISCTTVSESGDEGRAGGISGSDAGFNRQDVYDMQDRTFRQLAY